MSLCSIFKHEDHKENYGFATLTHMVVEQSDTILSSKDNHFCVIFYQEF